MREAKPTPPCEGNETAWLDGTVDPAHAGVYQRRTPWLVGREWLWSRWDGHFWFKMEPTAEAAAKASEHSKRQYLDWRGCSIKQP